MHEGCPVRQCDGSIPLLRLINQGSSKRDEPINWINNTLTARHRFSSVLAARVLLTFLWIVFFNQCKAVDIVLLEKLGCQAKLAGAVGVDNISVLPDGT